MTDKLTDEQITGYLQGTLTEAERQAVEIYFLEHPEALEDIEVEIALRDAVKSNASAFEPARADKGGGLLARVTEILTVPWLSLACAAVAVIFGIVISLNWPAGTLEVTGELELGQIRGSQRIPSIEHPDQGMLRLKIDLGSLSHPISGELIGTGQILNLEIPETPERVVLVDIPVTSLEATSYQVVLLGSLGKRREYSFRLN